MSNEYTGMNDATWGNETRNEFWDLLIMKKTKKIIASNEYEWM